MDFFLVLLAAFVMGHVLRGRYQRTHIALLGRHLSSMQLEKHMESITNTYSRAIKEESEARQLQVFATVNQTEEAVAVQMHQLALAMSSEPAQITKMSALVFNLPFLTAILPRLGRDFRAVLQIHAAGLRYVVDNEAQYSSKDRAFHLSAELYLFQHSCHWFCKSRPVADARLMVRHKIDHQKVLDSVSAPTRKAYERWLAQH